MSKGVLLILLVQFTQICNAANSQRIDVITVEYPPFTSSSSENSGLLFELLYEMTNNEKVKWLPFFVPPARAAQLINSNRWCASFYPITKQDIAFEQYKLSDELVKLGLYRIKQVSEFQWDNLDELKGKSITLPRSSENAPFNQQFIAAGLKIIFVENVEIALKMLLKNRVDFAFGDKDSVVKSALPMEDQQKLQFSKSILLEVQLSIFINPKCNISLPEKFLIFKQ